MHYCTIVNHTIVHFTIVAGMLGILTNNVTYKNECNAAKRSVEFQIKCNVFTGLYNDLHWEVENLLPSRYVRRGETGSQ